MEISIKIAIEILAGKTLKLIIQTSKRNELIDITSEIQEELKKSKVADGICVVSTMHTTTAIIINEDETGLKEDTLNLLEKLIPKAAGYKHDAIDNNADAHLKAVLLGTSESLPISEGKLELGTWQRVFLAELDGPRSRTVNISILKA